MSDTPDSPSMPATYAGFDGYSHSPSAMDFQRQRAISIQDTFGQKPKSQEEFTREMPSYRARHLLYAAIGAAAFGLVGTAFALVGIVVGVASGAFVGFIVSSGMAGNEHTKMYDAYLTEFAAEARTAQNRAREQALVSEGPAATNPSQSAPAPTNVQREEQRRAAEQGASVLVCS
jgi:hypothetical protein